MSLVGALICVEMSAFTVLLLVVFQAEDGIRDVAVTGVQTCARPILLIYYPLQDMDMRSEIWFENYAKCEQVLRSDRSAERRVGKECRSRWSPCH